MLKIVIEATSEEIMNLLKIINQNAQNQSEIDIQKKHFRLERIPYTNHYVYVEDK